MRLPPASMRISLSILKCYYDFIFQILQIPSCSGIPREKTFFVNHLIYYFHFIQNSCNPKCICMAHTRHYWLVWYRLVPWKPEESVMSCNQCLFDKEFQRTPNHLKIFWSGLVSRLVSGVRNLWNDLAAVQNSLVSSHQFWELCLIPCLILCLLSSCGAFSLHATPTVCKWNHQSVKTLYWSVTVCQALCLIHY